MKVFNLIIFLFFSLLLFGQSEKSSKYKKIRNDFWEQIDLDQKEQALSLAKRYIKNAKFDNLVDRLAIGYELASHADDYPHNLTYLDSIFSLVPKLNPDDYPHIIHITKGHYYYVNDDFNKAMSELITAQEYALEKDNIPYLNEIESKIANIRNVWGQYSEALIILEKQLKYKESNPELIESDKEGYLIDLIGILQTYNRLKNYDKFDAVYKKAEHILKDNEFNDFEEYLDNLKLCNAIKLIDLKDYTKGLKLLNEINYNDGKSFIVNVIFYKGKAHFKLKDEKKAIYYYERMDSLIKINNVLFPEFREAYEDVVDIHKINDNPFKELESTKRLLVIDSILNSRKYFINNQTKKYDTSTLIHSKDNIINRFKRKQITQIIIIVSLILLLFVSIFLFIRSQKRKEAAFQKLISDFEKPKTTLIEPKTKGVPKEIADDIVKKLKDFEEKNLFLDKSITLASLSKDFETNTSYLSKVINNNTSKNFNQYLRELRINYALIALKDKKMRKYSISTLAEEFGFKSAPVFSSAFSAVTGISPSIYMKKLDRYNHNDL